MTLSSSVYSALKPLPQMSPLDLHPAGQILINADQATNDRRSDSSAYRDLWGSDGRVVVPFATVIQFDQAGRRFNYRVVGVAIHEGAVLLHRAGDEPFWTLPGGRAEISETAENTIRREMREELSTEVEVLRLLWFVENFFEYDGLSYHEVALYFLIRFPPRSKPMARSVFEAADGGTTLRFRWVPLEGETLANLRLLPSFLALGLRELPTTVTHVVHRDNMPNA